MFEDPYSQFVLNESKWVKTVNEKANKIFKDKEDNIKNILNKVTYSYQSVVLLRLMWKLSEKYKCNFWFPLDKEEFKPLSRVINYLETLTDEEDNVDFDSFSGLLMGSRKQIEYGNIVNLVESEQMKDAIELCLDLAAGEYPKDTKGVFTLSPDLIKRLHDLFVEIPPTFTSLTKCLTNMMCGWKYEFVKFFENDVLPTMRRELRSIGIPLIDDCDKGKKNSERMA